MAHKSLSLIIIFALMVSANAAYGGRKALSSSDSLAAVDPVALPPGFEDLGFVPLNRKDSRIVQLAQYAINEHNKAENSKLVYTFVLEALRYTGSDGGESYELVVGIGDVKKEVHSYTIKVNVDKANNKKITLFKKND